MRPTPTLALLTVAMAACGGNGQATTTAAPPAEQFELAVAPAKYFPITPGQWFVVVVSPSGGNGTVEVTASVAGDATVEPASTSVSPGDVAEFTLVASQESVGSTLDLQLTAVRGEHRQSRTLPIEVVEWSDDIRPLATELRDRFVAYLETERPELGITSTTKWTPTITKPQILVVMHYLFFSEDWEMGVMWHVTVPEHAWSRMYLRPRAEFSPTLGLEIPSYLDPEALPTPFEPPTEIDR